MQGSRAPREPYCTGIRSTESREAAQEPGRKSLACLGAEVWQVWFPIEPGTRESGRRTSPKGEKNKTGDTGVGRPPPCGAGNNFPFLLAQQQEHPWTPSQWPREEAPVRSARGQLCFRPRAWCVLAPWELSTDVPTYGLLRTPGIEFLSPSSHGKCLIPAAGRRNAGRPRRPALSDYHCATEDGQRMLGQCCATPRPVGASDGTRHARYSRGPSQVHDGPNYSKSIPCRPSMCT